MAFELLGLGHFREQPVPGAGESESRRVSEAMRGRQRQVDDPKGHDQRQPPRSQEARTSPRD